MSPISPLPGWPAATLILRGVLFQDVALTCALPIGLEGVLPGEWYYWGIPALVLALCFTAVGMVLGYKGLSKRKAEIRAGYTTVPKAADEHPEVYYLARQDYRVICAPNEPRPRTGRRRDVEEHIAHRTPSS